MSSRLVVNSVRHTGASADGITLDSSGNVTFPANATCSGTATGFGKFTKYAVIGDVKANDVDGGTFTSGDWRTRDLNTELIDADDIVSISSNQFTLQAGTYFIEAQAMAYRVNRHMVKLYQTSGTPADIAFGTSMYANSAYNGNNFSFVKARVTITTATTYEIRHQGDTNHSTFGFGLGSNFSTTELFTVVQIFKEE